jgi:hypothetical protein
MRRNIEIKKFFSREDEKFHHLNDNLRAEMNCRDCRSSTQNEMGFFVLGVVWE